MIENILLVVLILLVVFLAYLIGKMEGYNDAAKNVLRIFEDMSKDLRNKAKKEIK